MTHLQRLGMLLLIGTGWAGCLRAPIRDDAGEGTGEARSTSSGDGEQDADDSTASDTTAEPGDACHASYVPCLPIVDELDCPDVVALGAAPVRVIGPDVYGLDSDDDGIGCET